jgi:hypothetical protein
MPITLIHSIGKFIAKVLVNRLTPMLQELLHVRQNAFIKAFIKGRFIHGSFKLIHALAKHLHARKVPSLLLKVDIARSTRFLGCSCCKPCKPLASPPLGGTGCPPCYLRLALRYCLMEHQGRGFVMLTDLRQGDSLSPLFFLLIMEVMSTMFRRADDWSLLQPLNTQTIPHRVSLYADDMVMFLARGSRISSLLVIFYRCSRTCPALVAIWQSANWPRSVILRSKLKWRSPSSHARRCISPSNI